MSTTAQTADLLAIPAFSGLPEDQLQWFLAQSQELHFAAGTTLANAGDPADSMIVLLAGEIQVRGEMSGETFIATISAPQVAGLLPYSRMKTYPVTTRTVVDSHILLFPEKKFHDLVQRMPQLAERLVAMMTDRVREYTRREQQRDRLVALGKLSAGLAHELNNPASAARRAASQMRHILEKIRDAAHELGRRNLTPTQKAEIEKLESLIMKCEEPPPDTLAMADLEEQLDSLLRSHGQNDLWQLAAGLAHRNIHPEVLETIFDEFDAPTARAALVRVAAVAEVYSLLNEIESSSARISDLVLAIKEYTYMDQSPVQNVDIVKSLESTLTILNHKLKKGVTVQREYQKIPLLVNSFGSELNQVWTNLIDNAIDAMGGNGELRVRVYRSDSCIVVEIGDNGPGISSEILTHIFEPFFTTKGVGEGTGLGLDTVQRIIKKHRGTIQVNSKPGDTVFQVWLPVAEAAA